LSPSPQLGNKQPNFLARYRPPTDRPRPRRPKPSSGRSGRFPRPTTRPEIVAADGAARRCHIRPRAPR
jgi:hypothetical protein